MNLIEGVMVDPWLGQVGAKETPRESQAGTCPPATRRAGPLPQLLSSPHPRTALEVINMKIFLRRFPLNLPEAPTLSPPGTSQAWEPVGLLPACRVGSPGEGTGAICTSNPAKVSALH